MGKQVLLQKLYQERDQLIAARSVFVDSIFYLFRRSLKNKVKEIDVRLDTLDAEISSVRRALNFSRPVSKERCSQR
jgi:malate synthase